MAPGFLSKFVKNGSSSHNRERSDRSLDASRMPSGSPIISRARALSAGPLPSSYPKDTSSHAITPSSSKFLERMSSTLAPSVSINISPDTSSTDVSRPPSVTIVPPSPLIGNGDLSASSSSQDLSHRDARAKPNQDDSHHTRSRTISAPPQASASTASLNNVTPTEDNLPTPTPNRAFTVFGLPLGLSISRPPSRAPSPAPSASNLREAASPSTKTFASPSSSPGPTSPKGDSLMPSALGQTLEPAKELRKQASSKSLRQAAPPINTSHARAATSPGPSAGAPRGSLDSQTEQEIVIAYNPMTPIVESPTALKSHEVPTPNVITGNAAPSEISNSPNNTPTTTTSTYSSITLLSPGKDSDSISVNSAFSRDKDKDKDKDKKRPWRRSTAPRKPTGLANALAATGLAMANPSMSAAHQAQFSPPASISPTGVTSPSRKSSGPNSPIQMPRSPAGSTSHARNGSADYAGANGGGGSVFGRSKRSNSNVRAMSANSDNVSEFFGANGVGVDDRPGYYSGLEEGTSDEENGSASDDFADMDGDLPVTGFAVANNKRNADFHQLFPAIPEGDYLIEDYGCALQREILVQGRIYISENHICFHSNILGWVTDLLIPISEITSLEKKTTVLFIPNAIQITTRQAKYTFASFLARDTTFDVIYNIWRIARPQNLSNNNPNGKGGASSKTLTESPLDTPIATDGNMGQPKGGLQNKVTECKCGKTGQHYPEVALEATFPGTPDRIYNLIFASGFIKVFMAVDQKLQNIQMSDWCPIEPGSHLLTRQMSYIKPLNNSMGPRQTKCEIRDDTAYCDFEDYVSTVTSTKTPDVPSGKAFEVKTRTCITWASAVSSKVVVTTQVEWSGRSYIKSIIERSAIEGQKSYHADLEKAIRAYIRDHQSEFVPAGVDADAIPTEAVTPTAENTPGAKADAAAHLSPEEERKQKEHERNQRGLQWAWDTFDGVCQVATASARGAWELLKDAWDQSSSTTILWFVIVLLLISNVWTLLKMGTREEAGRRKEIKKTEEREKWIHGVVTALWEELNASGMRVAGASGVYPGQYGSCGGGIGIVPPGVIQDGQPPTQSPPVLPNGHVQFDPGMWKREVEGLQLALNGVEERVKVLRESLSTVQRSLHDVD